GRGLGAVMTVLAVVGVPSMSAFADSTTCYTGCTPPTTLVGPGTGGSGGTSGGGRRDAPAGDGTGGFRIGAGLRRGVGPRIGVGVGLRRRHADGGVDQVVRRQPAVHWCRHRRADGHWSGSAS